MLDQSSEDLRSEILAGNQTDPIYDNEEPSLVAP